MEKEIITGGYNMVDKKNKILEFFGWGVDDEYEDAFEDEFETGDYYEEEPVIKKKRTKVVPVQERAAGAKSSVVIYSPRTYNDAQPLVMKLIQHKHVIIKLDKVDRRVGQRILDFMSGAAYASDSQVTEVSKGNIYLFASNQTYIDKVDEMESNDDAQDEGFTLEDEF